jgi:hypothetical protein
MEVRGKQGKIERSKEINAQILIESNLNQGTRVELIVPV